MTSESRPPRRRRRPSGSRATARPGPAPAHVREARLAGIPAITYPEALPVSARRDDIAAAIRDHQVVVIAGETGSGKTTQIPKICLDLGRGVDGMIGHTQPRRIAARSVAERIAEELGVEMGTTVGYAVRFTDRVSEATSVKLMTDGILLAEIQRDRLLRRYDTIIIDEAHERSLNIDFLLGYLRTLLPRRPDLKLIITSATIDPDRFARHFADASGEPAPIIEVSGRTYPVEIRYRPLTTDIDDRTIDIDPLDGLCDAVAELMREGNGDILVFLSGEREIRDAADALEGRRLRSTEILPLFGRLSASDQHKVFSAHTGRRVVLATNVAETSLTVPGIRYVVDTGYARISRYSTRTKVQRLPIEPVSRASANQRSGRCGRVADGVCIRLYSEDDFLARPEFTEPEILRTNLASVILQMASLGLGAISEFPFVEPPDARAIRDGINLLTELGALDTGADPRNPSLTATGRELARIPVDPRMARMLVQARANGALAEALVVVSALSIQDVRERPAAEQARADQLHARFKDQFSDFTSYLKLWVYIHEKRRELSGNAFRRLCREEYLHWLRIREWQDLYAQLRSICAELGWEVPGQYAVTDPSANDTAVHQALLSGLLSHIGVRAEDGREFQGARGTRFLVFPGSSLAKKPPRWVMASEMVETSRLWARDVARIEPDWVERLAGDLAKRSYSEPHWSTRMGAAMAYERVTVYGVPIVERRRVNYSRVDPEAARELFIRHALVQGEWNSHHGFLRENRRLVDEVGEWEEKARRHDLLVDEETLFEFYDRRLPAEAVSVRHFDSWWKKASRSDPHLLDLDLDTLLDENADYSAGDFPDSWRQDGMTFDLTYRFDPRAEDDGVTVRIPLALLAQTRADGFDWLVPGLRAELFEELIRTLPKPSRRLVVPAPDHAKRALAEVRVRQAPVVDELARVLTRQAGFPIRGSDMRPGALPSHLRMTFAAIDEDGGVVASGKSLAALRERLAEKVTEAVGSVSGDVERAPSTVWTAETLGAVPETVTSRVGGQEVVAHPALAATADGVAVKAFPTATAAKASMFSATLTMLLRNATVSAKQMLNGLPPGQRLAVGRYPHRGQDGLINDCRMCAVRDLLVEAGGPVRTPEAYADLEHRVTAQAPGRTRRIVVSVAPLLEKLARIEVELEDRPPTMVADIRGQLDDLFGRGFVTRVGTRRLGDYPRYLEAIEQRLETHRRDPSRDTAPSETLERVLDEYRARVAALPAAARRSPDVRAIAWMIEELRISLFAQRVGTAGPISEKRIRRELAKLGR